MIDLTVVQRRQQSAYRMLAASGLHGPRRVHWEVPFAGLGLSVLGWAVVLGLGWLIWQGVAA